jgi:uncharacterized protein YndB with AHSA1/START domain
VITVALSATIGAPVDRVWRALTDPTERPLWDERVLGRVESPRHGARDARSRPGTTRSGAATDPRRRTRWRFRLGAVPLVMQEDLLEEKPNERLVGRVSMGSMQFDQTLTLHREDDADAPQTRLGMKLVARNQIAVIGEVVERLDVQKIVIEYVDTTLRQVQKHCEGGG